MFEAIYELKQTAFITATHCQYCVYKTRASIGIYDARSWTHEKRKRPRAEWTKEMKFLSEQQNYLPHLSITNALWIKSISFVNQRLLWDYDF